MSKDPGQTTVNSMPNEAPIRKTDVKKRHLEPPLKMLQAGLTHQPVSCTESQWCRISKGYSIPSDHVCKLEGSTPEKMEWYVVVCLIYLPLLPLKRPWSTCLLGLPNVAHIAQQTYGLQTTRCSRRGNLWTAGWLKKRTPKSNGITLWFFIRKVVNGVG